MIKNKPLFLAIFFAHLTGFCFSQNAKVVVPPFGDKYSKYVQQLENGDLNIDFADFRNSFLESKQFSKKSIQFDSLRKQVFIEIKNKNYPNVVSLTIAMLNIDYTSIFAHKYLYQTYKILNDTLNQKKYHDIEFGLLHSIINSGDGKTCSTGWHVTQIDEEYFILDMIGATLQMQSISSGGTNTCDQMTVTTEKGETRSYYFEANKVFEQEDKLYGK
jgi:hypothetical protein